MGPLRILFITDTERVLRVEEDRVILKDGKCIDTRQFRGILIFGKVKNTPAVPTVIVSEKGISFRNIPVVSKCPEDQVLRCLEDLWRRTRSLLGGVLRENRVKSIGELLAWLEVERLFFYTLSGLLLILVSGDLTLRVDPGKYFKGFDLWRLLFLLPVSYSVMREVSKTLRYELSGIREPKVAVGTALSYLFGDAFFFHLFKLNREILIRHGLADLDPPEPHRSLPPDTRELAEPRESVYPPQDLRVSALHIEDHPACEAEELTKF